MCLLLNDAPYTSARASLPAPRMCSARCHASITLALGGTLVLLYLQWWASAYVANSGWVLGSVYFLPWSS